MALSFYFKKKKRPPEEASAYIESELEASQVNGENELQISVKFKEMDWLDFEQLSEFEGY